MFFAKKIITFSNYCWWKPKLWESKPNFKIKLTLQSYIKPYFFVFEEGDIGGYPILWTAKPSVFFSKSVKKPVKRGVRVLRARGARASHARRACEVREKKPTVFLASLPSLALCFQPHSRPYVWLLARTWIRKNMDCFAVYQYCNTVRKIGKYQNTVSKIDEIPIPHLWSVMLTYT